MDLFKTKMCSQLKCEWGLYLNSNITVVAYGNIPLPLPVPLDRSFSLSPASYGIFEAMVKFVIYLFMVAFLKLLFSQMDLKQFTNESTKLQK